MSLYLCLDCNNIYDDHYAVLKKDSGGDYYCPVVNCGGVVVQLDEYMIEPIKILNNKGYHTMNCCSGHLYEHGNGYIQFEQLAANMHIIKNPPEEWFYYKNDDGTLNEYLCEIAYNPEGELYSSERVKSISSHMINLLDWCNNLPDIINLKSDEKW